MAGTTGRTVRQLRTNLGVTQAAMARVFRVSSNTVARWERGEVGVPLSAVAIDVLARLARADVLLAMAGAAVDFQLGEFERGLLVLRANIASDALLGRDHRASFLKRLETLEKAYKKRSASLARNARFTEGDPGLVVEGSTGTSGMRADLIGLWNNLVVRGFIHALERRSGRGR